ncbi:MAG: DUF2889 domain-containing protein [Actinobacteria bacterium]|nr:DUF2889 domain-containing protein [Actinomycetota bacterium]
MTEGWQFTRDIALRTRPGEEGRLVIAASLRDHRLGEPIHYIDVEAEVGIADGTIHRIRGEMPHIPHEDCRLALRRLDLLVGERIIPGFSDLVRGVVGSSEGCTHLAVLVMNLGNVSVQGRAAFAHAMLGEGEARRMIAAQAEELGLPGSCITWREDGPIMSRLQDAQGGLEA